MTQALAETIPGAEASRMEIDRGGPSYTVDDGRGDPRQAAEAAARPRRSSSWWWGPTWCLSSGTWERVDDLQATGHPGRGLAPDRGPDPEPSPAGLAGASGWTGPRWTCPARRCARSWPGAARSTIWCPPGWSVAFAAAICTLSADERHAGQITELSRGPRHSVRAGAPPVAGRSAGPSAGRAGVARRIPSALGDLRLRRPRGLPSHSPWGSWTCSIEPRVGRPRPAPAGGGHGGTSRPMPSSGRTRWCWP